MSRYTRSFERYVLELSRHTTIADAANHLGVSWDVVKDIQKRYLQRRFSRPGFAHLKRIAIDEIYVGKRRTYLTIVLDLDTGAVAFVGEGKGANALEPFWRRLKASRTKVEAVAIDMSQAYIHAVTVNLPKAVLVFDHFHVIKLFNLPQLFFMEPTKHGTITNAVVQVFGYLYMELRRPNHAQDESYASSQRKKT